MPFVYKRPKFLTCKCLLSFHRNEINNVTFDVGDSQVRRTGTREIVLEFSRVFFLCIKKVSIFLFFFSLAFFFVVVVLDICQHYFFTCFSLSGVLIKKYVK